MLHLKQVIVSSPPPVFWWGANTLDNSVLCDIFDTPLLPSDAVADILLCSNWFSLKDEMMIQLRWVSPFSTPLNVCGPLLEYLHLSHVQGAADVAETGQGQLQVPDIIVKLRVISQLFIVYLEKTLRGSLYVDDPEETHLISKSPVASICEAAESPAPAVSEHLT